MPDPSIAAQNEQLFQKLIPPLQAEFGDDLLGIQATGSRIHGTPGPTSDLDLNVIIASPRRQRRNIMLDGLEIEMFINPVFQVHRYFEDEGGNDQHMYGFGQIIYDPHGVMAQLQAEARAQWDAGPPPIYEEDVWQHRYHAADLLRDIEDIAAEDRAATDLLFARLIENLISTHYQLHHRWPQKPKCVLQDLEQWDPRATRLVRLSFAQNLLPERRAALQQLADHVLAPLGGLMPLEWSTEWEELQQ